MPGGGALIPPPLLAAADRRARRPSTLLLFGLALGALCGCPYLKPEGDHGPLPISFSAEVLDPAAGGPTSVAVVDINGDRRPDLVTANGDTDNVSVLLGVAGGGFAKARLFPTGAHPRFVGGGDFNGDGRADLVTVNLEGGGNDVSVLLQRDDGAFAPAVSSPALPGPAATVVADLDGDRRADMILVHNQAVLILRGRGDGTLALAALLPGATAVVADLDGDHRLDVATGGKSGLLVHPGVGDGTFRLPISVRVEGAGRLAAGDLDGDGRPDLAIVEVGGGVTVLLNRGQWTFAAGKEAGIRDARADRPATLADLDGDRRLDLALHDRVFLGQGDGTFGAALPLPRPERYELGDHAVGDLDGDGRPDLAVLATSSVPRTGLGLLFSQGRGRFEYRPGPALSPTSVGAFVAADFNGDHRADLAVVSAAAVEVRLADPGGGFQPLTAMPFERVWAMGSADFTGDGRPDLVLSVAGPSGYRSQRLRLLTGRGDGRFDLDDGTASDATPAFGFGSHPILADGDFDGDGRRDLAVGLWAERADTTPVAVLLGRGDGTFRRAASLEIPWPAADPERRFDHLEVADLDGDGVADLLLGGAVPWTVIARGRGDGSFRIAGALPAPPVGRRGLRAVSDLDGDRRPDLVTVLEEAGRPERLELHRGVGDGSFRAPTLLDGEAFVAAAADFDGDARTDLAVASGWVRILQGLGGGQFAPPQAVLRLDFAGSAVFQLTAHDLEGDRRPDLVALRYGGLIVLHNETR